MTAIPWLWPPASEGPQGEAGPAGDAGLPGNQGPAGPPGMSGNPYIDPPATPNAMDDEFNSGSSDFAARGWNCLIGGAAGIRDGDIELNTAAAIPPAAGHYRSTRVGSVMYVQAPTGDQGIILYKSIPAGAVQSNYTVRARVLGGYRFNKNKRRVFGTDSLTFAAGGGAIWMSTFMSAAGVPQYWWLGTDNIGGANAWGVGPTDYPTSSRQDVLMFCRQGSYAYGATIDSGAGSCEYTNNPRTALGYNLTKPHPYWGLIISCDVVATGQDYLANTFAIDYLRFSDATVLTPQSGWFG